MKSSTLSKRKPSYGGPTSTGGLLGSGLPNTQSGNNGMPTSMKPRFKAQRGSVGNGARLNYSAIDGSSMPSFLIEKNSASQNSNSFNAGKIILFVYLISL